MLAKWNQMKKFYRGSYIDASCQVWFHLVQLFQRSRLKYEKLTDGRQVMAIPHMTLCGFGMKRVRSINTYRGKFWKGIDLDENLQEITLMSLARYRWAFQNLLKDFNLFLSKTAIFYASSTIQKPLLTLDNHSVIYFWHLTITVSSTLDTWQS